MTQAQQILQYLQDGNSITPLEALHKFGCLRLGARIWDLRNAGHIIKTESYSPKPNCSVARYRLEK